jgi:rubrerythrin
MHEEITAVKHYHQRAKEAHRIGDKTSAKLWEHIAGEEEKHYNEFQSRLAELQRRK